MRTAPSLSVRKMFEVSPTNRLNFESVPAEGCP